MIPGRLPTWPQLRRNDAAEMDLLELGGRAAGDLDYEDVFGALWVLEEVEPFLDEKRGT